MTHLSDAHSQANLESIEDNDFGGYVENGEMNDYVNEDVGMEDMPIVDEETLSPMNDNDEPILGKSFAGDDNAYIFYNQYAMKKGFGTRKLTSTKSRTTGEIIRRIYVCNKEGKKYLVHKEDQEIQRHRDTRTGCMARMEVAKRNGEWIVDKFIDVHNHIISPSKVFKHRSHSKYHRSANCQSLMSKLNGEGLEPSQITRVVNAISRSQEVDITPRQCSKYLRIERKNNVGQECYGIIKHFQEKAITDGSYFFTMDLAKDGSLRRVFWADERLRTSYSQFGDVVVFDVTYKTNKFMLPFAPFVGVNHHRQTILLGAALLEDETEETFVWVFEQFLKCMFHRPPIAIITDQDRAMGNAIKRVFPNTHHRFCAWHIRKHVLEHLQPLRSRYEDFSETYNKWVKSRNIIFTIWYVVVFDVTYKTNKFMLSFAPFVGVNHHRQTILLGVALLKDKIKETFAWVFEQFLKCMFHRPPIAIITDQDGAMGNAIKRVFPSTHHRFCAWLIRKHVLEHLQPLRSCYEDFSETYNKWVKSRTIEEFEMGWEALKYVIEKRSWLTNMYKLRHHWVKAYLKDIFFAGMTTSGRTESIHSFFDGYVNTSTRLNEFVQQYDKAIKARRDEEEDEDFRTINSKAVLYSMHPIEEHAGVVYTQRLFELFKKEWKDSLACVHDKLCKDGTVTKYIIWLHIQDKCLWRMVEYDLSGDISATCTCAKFETDGILCKHILYIMRKKKLQAIPKHYILHRWTIDARYQVGSVGGGIIGTYVVLNENVFDPLTLFSVRAKFSQAIEDASNCPSDIQEMDTWLSNFMVNLVIKKKANRIAVNEADSQVSSTMGMSQLHDMDHISICDPVALVRTKGRLKTAARYKSRLELSADA